MSLADFCLQVPHYLARSLYPLMNHLNVHPNSTHFRLLVLVITSIRSDLHQHGMMSVSLSAFSQKRNHVHVAVPIATWTLDAGGF
jgi:hypothetical protein